jgi:hypothetical protein
MLRLRGIAGIALGVLLTVSGFASAAMGEGASVVPDSLKSKALDRDLVRVIVQLRVAGLPEGRLGSAEAEASARQAIAEVQCTLLRQLAGTNYRVVRTYETIPFLALEASLDALRVLEGSALVMNIQEDRVESPQGKPDGPIDDTGRPLADPRPVSAPTPQYHRNQGRARELKLLAGYPEIASLRSQ